MPYKDKDAARAAWRRWYASGDNAKYYRDRSHRKRRELLKWFREYKATLRCKRCPENHPACLDFHHEDPKKKDFSLHRAISMKASKVAILKEIAKCIVLCANCHRKEHARIV